jgi:hypothetical protein
MKRTQMMSFVIAVAMILATGPFAIADPPGLVIGGVDGDMSQSMKNFSLTTPNLTLDATEGTQKGDAAGFVFGGGHKDKVSIKLSEQQEVVHFQEQNSQDYSSAIGGQIEQNLDISGVLRRNGEFDLSAFSKEKTSVVLGRDGNSMESLIKSKTLEGIEGTINGTGKIDANLSTTKYLGYFQEAINPDSYTLHFGQLDESINLRGSLGVRSCDPSISGAAFTKITGSTETNSVVTPTLNSASASQFDRLNAGIIGGRGVTGEVKVNMVNGYEQSSSNPTSQIKQSGISSTKIDITKKPLR